MEEVVLMGWRFRKSINLGSGIRLNLSKSGVGVSMGTRGARVGIGPRGLRTSVGLPGTGIYWEKRTSLGTKTGQKTRDSVTDIPATTATPQIKIGFLQSLSLDPGERALIEAINVSLQQEREQAAAKAREAVAKNKTLADGHFLLALVTTNAEERYRALEAALSNRLHFGKYFSRYQVTLTGKLDLTEELTLQIVNDELGLLLFAAEVFQEKGEFMRAGDLLATSFYKDEPVVRLALGEIYCAQGEHDQCVEVLQGIENEDAVGTTALLYLGRAFRAQGYYEAATDAFSRALRRRKGRAPQLLREIRYQRARTYEEMGKAAKARKEYEQVLAEDANYEDVKERLQGL
jgi:tetratricopeptide (TPR) repeat protein